MAAEQTAHRVDTVWFGTPGVHHNKQTCYDVCHTTRQAIKYYNHVI